MEVDPNELHRLPHSDPVSGGDLYVSELTSEQSGVTIRGKFAIPAYAKLNTEQAHFLETFLRCRGVISSVERELGISYPTVRARLDSLLDTLGLTPAPEEKAKRDRTIEKKRKILEQLEKGEISAADAKEKIRQLTAPKH